MSNTGFSTVKYPSSRVATFDVGRIGAKKHHIAGFLEIDVTEARRAVRERTSAGEVISFTSWLVSSIARVIAKNPRVQGILNRKKKLIVFDDVDIALPVERSVQGERVPLVLLIQGVNKKSIAEIYRELREAQTQKITDEGDFVLGEGKPTFLMRLFYAMPQWMRMKIWKGILNNPFKRKKEMGTAVITSIGMAGSFSGWILPKSMHNLSFGVGSIVKKPWVVENQVEIREILHLTVLFDHDVIDGAPAARFIKSLVHYLEKPQFVESEVLYPERETPRDNL